MANPLRDLAAARQAVWLDYLHRDLIAGGELAQLIQQDAVTGLTSNPAIFEKAIGSGQAYDAPLAALMAARDGEVVELYESLAVADIQAAADVFRPLYDRLNGRDGFVSLEVSPYLAHDAEGTLAEARRLWAAVDRPNLMIKVPGTVAGAPAVRALIGQGINVNVTLLFSLESYLAVAEAHIAGLEDLAARGGDLSRIHGVASVFISRIDSRIDGEIDRRSAAGDPQAAALRALRGKIAIANAKVAYARYQAMIASPRWAALAAKGASPQRLLWASTGAKDPAYSDVLYVETLIGPDTVNTMPPATLAAFRDHGVAAQTLTLGLADAEAVLSDAARLGLDLDGVTAALQAEGVVAFAKSFDDLLGAVAAKRAAILGAALDAQSVHAGDLAQPLAAAAARAAAEGWGRRLWAKDAGLWTNGPEGQWLDWLEAARGETVDFDALDDLSARVKAGGFTHALLLGMGGSSLGPETLAAVQPAAAGYPQLLVLDSTVPSHVRRIAAGLDPARTLFIVASKSGSTLEPDVLHRYFYGLAEAALGVGRAGGHFVAITDPGSKLEAVARDQGFMAIFHGLPRIGGRYSVLSHFGMVPAAILGLDPRALFQDILPMTRACGPSAPPLVNPGVLLGLLMGVGAAAGRDKLTISADDALAPLGPWLEQLVAESTGKLGLGIIPIVGEPLREPDAYGPDRLFVDLRLPDSRESAAREPLLARLQAVGHPVVRITMTNPGRIGQEFVRWEVATAIAGAVMGIDPFDQPDVESSKIKTRALTDAYEADGALPADPPFARDGDLTFHGAASDARALSEAEGLVEVLQAHLGRAGQGDYIGVLAYIDRNPRTEALLESMRAAILASNRAAVTVQFGPRFLHSTGQAYKGGPNSGVFLQITTDPVDGDDPAIPGRGLTFGVVAAAQARGDLQVLAERGRRLLRIHVQGDVEAGLQRIASALAPV